VSSGDSHLSRSVLRPGSPVTEKYEFIESCKLDSVKYAYPVRKMCQWLDVSASGFFDWKCRDKSATTRRREELTRLVVQIFKDSDETYGYRRVHAELGRRGVPAGLELVRSVMRDQGLVPCQPRPWRASLTAGDGSAGSIPDLVSRDFTADAPGEKMVGDITYIPTWGGWLYLCWFCGI
jgi:putative transposase